MLTNATIIRIDAAPAVLLDNSRVYSEGASTSVRCSWQDPKSGRKWILGATVADANAALYVQGNQTAAFELEGRALIQVDGESDPRLYLVLAVSPQVGLSMTNTEVYLQRIGNE